MKKSFAQAWQDYRLLLCIGAIYVALCTWQAFSFGISVHGFLGWTWMATRHVIGLAYSFLMLVMAGSFLREMYRAKWDFKTARKGFGAWFREYLSGPAFAGGLFGLLAAYTSLFFIIQKATVRWMHPYAWDQDFEALDRWLHFGRHPYEYLLRWFGGGNFDGILQASYIGWFFFMYVGLGWCLFCDGDRLRKLQFMWVFVTSWILLGGIGATILSSVCPVFYHTFYPNLPDAYGPLNNYFDAHKNSIEGIVFLHESLMKWHKNPATIIPNGIAAMPSMHAAISTLVTLYARRLNRWAFLGAATFAFMIIVSSIYFGFHYAIDSYFSIISILLMWWFAGVCLRRFKREPAA